MIINYILRIMFHDFDNIKNITIIFIWSNSYF